MVYPFEVGYRDGSKNQGITTKAAFNNIPTDYMVL